MISRALSLATVILACAQLASAQPIEPPAIGQIGLKLTVSTSASGKGDLKDGRNTYQDLSASQTSIEISQLVPLGERRRLSLGFEYDAVAIHKPDESRVPFPEQLKSLGASARYFQPINHQWMISASLGVGSYVTDTGLLSEGWGTRAAVIGIYNQSRQLTWMFGAAHNSLSEDLKFLPVFGVDWRPTPKWSIAFGFPRIGATYKMSEKLKLGIGLSGTGGAYYVKNDPLPGTAPRTLADSRLQHMEVRLGFHCDWKINDTFRLSGNIGQVLARRLKYIDRDYQLKSDGLAPFASLSGAISL